LIIIDEIIPGFGSQSMMSTWVFHGSEIVQKNCFPIIFGCIIYDQLIACDLILNDLGNIALE